LDVMVDRNGHYFYRHYAQVSSIAKTIWQLWLIIVYAEQNVDLL
jgi:hypothetical protein